MKGKALTLIPLALLIIGCIICAGCTTVSNEVLPGESLSGDRLIEPEESGTEGEKSIGSIDYSSSSVTIDERSVSYDTYIEDGARTLEATIDGKTYTLTANPADDAIVGTWIGKNSGDVVFKQDGTGSVEKAESIFTRGFFWGKNTDGTYQVVFYDNSVVTITMSQDTLTDSLGRVLTKKQN